MATASAAPLEIATLIADDDTEPRLFHQYIRRANSAFAFASTGARNEHLLNYNSDDFPPEVRSPSSSEGSSATSLSLSLRGQVLARGTPRFATTPAKTNSLGAYFNKLRAELEPAMVSIRRGLTREKPFIIDYWTAVERNETCRQRGCLMVPACETSSEPATYAIHAAGGTTSQHLRRPRRMYPMPKRKRARGCCSRHRWPPSNHM